MKRFNEEFLISELHRFAEENGRSPKCEDLGHNSGYPCIGAYINRFGSFNTALISAGLKVNICRGHSKEFLISELNRFVTNNNRLPVRDDLKLVNGYPNYTIYIYTFGSWANTIKIAGFEDYNNQIIKQFLINELHRFVKEHNRNPTSKDINRKNSGYPSTSGYRTQFGSFNNGLIAAGLNVNTHTNCDSGYLLDEIKRFVKENGRPPGYREFAPTNGYPTACLYKKTFGSFANALFECRLIPNIRKHTYNGTECCSHCGSTKTYSGWLYDENDNIMCRRCSTNIWFANNPEKFKQYKHIQDSKRRGYSATLLNDYFIGAHGHHVWEEESDFVIFIPNFIHALHWHNHNKPETMVTPNALAFDYFINEDLYKQLYLEGEP